MNGLQWTLVIAAALFVALLPVSRRLAIRYARLAVLTFVALIMLAPFAWLACSTFKDPAVLNEYSFLPPQATCVFRSGETSRLLPGWVGVLATALSVPMVIAGVGFVLAVRRWRGSRRQL